MKCDDLGFERTASVGSVTELQRQFPHLPAKVLVTLAVMTLLARTVTPFRLCQCGCGESVHGKARLASQACRKRVQRERDALATGAPKQFNIVLQYEIPVPIPSVPAPARHGSEISAPLASQHEPANTSQPTRASQHEPDSRQLF